MVSSYINLVKELSDERASISRKFYIVIEVNSNNKETRYNKIYDGLKGCGNIVSRCNKNEIIHIFNSAYKKAYKNLITNTV